MIPVLGYGDKPILGADYAQDWARCTTSSRERFFQKKKKKQLGPREIMPKIEFCSSSMCEHSYL